MRKLATLTAAALVAVFGFGGATVAQAVSVVDIDIKPFSDPNAINLCGAGVVPVAILGSADLDVNDIDPSTLLFGGGGVKMVGKPSDPKTMCHLEDVNGDGLDDLVCQFLTVELAIVEGDLEATVTGEIFDGTPIAGTDSIRISKFCDF